jgi:hypothetical protein
MRDGRAKRVVGIVDYKAGNIQSIENAFMHVGATVLRVRSASELESCTMWYCRAWALSVSARSGFRQAGSPSLSAAGH